MDYVSRKRAAELLAEMGLPCPPATLATLAVRGGGPPFLKFGRHVLYDREALLAWAQARLSPPRRTTSEAA